MAWNFLCDSMLPAAFSKALQDLHWNGSGRLMPWQTWTSLIVPLYQNPTPSNFQVDRVLALAPANGGSLGGESDQLDKSLLRYSDGSSGISQTPGQSCHRVLAHHETQTLMLTSAYIAGRWCCRQRAHDFGPFQAQNRGFTPLLPHLATACHVAPRGATSHSNWHAF